MANIINKTQHYKTIKKTCYTANIIYLIVHIFYLALFIVAKATALIYVTAAVVGIYFLYFLLIKAKKYYLYALICGNVFFGLISVTTVMAGFGTGFHFYLIGLCVVSFFTSYFSKLKDIKGSVVWVGLSLTIYLILYFTTRGKTPTYILPEWIEISLFTTNVVMVFAFIAAYMVVFLRYALSLEKKIMNESRTDELTQISNRYGLYDYFEDVEDTEKENLALALFDVDDFKQINDRYGHVTGDYILQKVAEITTKTLSEDFVCRYGGEEFVIVLKKENSREKLENLRKTIEKEVFEFEKVKAQITITIGVAEYSNNMELESWIEAADKKMYTGKKSGKNKVVI